MTAAGVRLVAGFAFGFAALASPAFADEGPGEGEPAAGNAAEPVAALAAPGPAPSPPVNPVPAAASPPPPEEVEPVVEVEAEPVSEPTVEPKASRSTLKRRVLYAARGATVAGWRSSDGWGAYGFNKSTRKPADSGGTLAWCLDHGLAPPSDVPTWSVSARSSSIPRAALNGGGSISGMQLARAGYVVSKWGDGLTSGGGTADQETAAAIMLAVYDVLGTRWPSGGFSVASLTTASFGGWSGYDTGRVLSEAKRMVAEAVANAAPGLPTLTSEWVKAPGKVGEPFSWRVRLRNGAGGGMRDFAVTVKATVDVAGGVRWTSPLTGVTDSNGHLTVTGVMAKKAKVTLSTELTVPEGSATVAEDPRFAANSKSTSQRLILADPEELSTSSSGAPGEPDPSPPPPPPPPDPGLTTSVSPKVVSGGDTVTETVTLTDGEPDPAGLTVDLYGPYTTKPTLADCDQAQWVGSWRKSEPATKPGQDQ